ncbi:hypothetical protein TWF730_009007 [Orbilia blumenaviensis]|uniref:Uncharacterized protein n=1 Tax=Orbilia blumenaviensis TaxID=1796055 RepID=A0AAV9V070_9PEZI
MKTAGDRNSLGGSQQLLPVYQARCGILKRRRSSHAAQRQPPNGMRNIAEGLAQMKLTEAYNKPAKGPSSPTSYIVGPSTDGSKLHDSFPEGGDDMCIDVPPSNTVSKGPNGSGVRSGDTAICAEDGVVDEFRIDVEIEADNTPVINGGVRIDDNSNLESGTASAQPSGEYVSTDASVWSGDSGNDPIASVEIVRGWSPPLGVMNLSQGPGSPPDTQRSSFYLQDQYGRRLSLQLDDFDRMFPLQDSRTP